jgi:rhodanese-related sulfurtransferase
MTTATDVATIERSELVGLLEHGEPLTLLETLPEDDYRRGHLPGALNVPLERLAELAAALIPDRTAPIVVYGAGPDGDAPTQAARELRGVGYIKVRAYRGGKKDWKDHGLPIEGGWVEPAPPVPHKSRGPRATGRHRPRPKKR